MPSHPMSGPDSAQSTPSATGALRAQLDDASFETDFAELAARFAAQSGGGLSAELSADLALEIVLNEIVEQACLATGASGAAIVLQRDGEMVCRASSGTNAPELGARLDTTSGLSGACVQTLRIQRCDDVLLDPRADVAASKRLGIRSVMVMPLLRRGEVVGVFELFSTEPNAFGEQDERTVELLCVHTLSNLERASERLEPHPRDLPVAEAVSEIPRVVPDGIPPRRYDTVTTLLGAAVLVCAILLGVLLGRHLGIQKTSVRKRPSSVPSATVHPANHTEVATGQEATTQKARPAVDAKSVARTSIPPGGLVVSENGREVFRMMPAQGEQESSSKGAVQSASTREPEKTLELSANDAESSLIHRVEPQYPEDALQSRDQGAVVLEVLIGANGAVRDVQVISGLPRLARASTDAVKQWRFKTHKVNGRPAEMQTTVTLNFRLPEGN